MRIGGQKEAVWPAAQRHARHDSIVAAARAVKGRNEKLRSEACRARAGRRDERTPQITRAAKEVQSGELSNKEFHHNRDYTKGLAARQDRAAWGDT
jgi:hypothetical protein